MKNFITLLLILLCCAPPSPSQVCAGVTQHLSSSEHNKYASLIATTLRGNLSPADIHINHMMRSGGWTLVFADHKNAEPGVFFFHVVNGKDVWRETWGGILGPDPEEDAVTWTKTLDPIFPGTLAKCFAHAVR